jgi:radical SAM superfamily enzyme YgiQ (UPF0313 family)
MLEVRNGKEIPFDDRGRMEPLQLGVLAGLTPDDIDVTLFDDRLEAIDYELKADFVAISVEIFTAKRAYEIAAEYRKRHIPVILGGIHVSTLPEEAKAHADCIIVGDAEGVWPDVLNDFSNHCLKERYDSKIGRPHPGRLIRRSIYDGKQYFPASLMQFARGCPYKCSFCSSGSYFNGAIYNRNIDEVLAEIKHQPRKLVFFVDENIVGNREESKALFRALIPLKIRWFGQASIDMTDDPELMDLLEKSGCIGLIIGFESVSSKGLKAYNKSPNQAQKYVQQIKIIRKHRIHIWAAFLLGHDDETAETLQETLDFAIGQRFSFAAFNLLMPYPHTLIYKQLEAESRLLFDGKWWLSPQYRFNSAAYVPKNMTAEELTRRCYLMRKKYNSFPIILKRMFSPHILFNVKTYALMWQVVLLFRRETFKKQGMLLGYEKKNL